MSATRSIRISSEDEMSALGAKIAPILSPGTMVLLNGPIGAGKTHLARAIVQTLLPTPEDVPSPTYTLVQTYQTQDTEIWHADLYRLADSSEVVELGLDDAIQSAIVLVEWPDRLPASMIPRSAIRVEIEPIEDDRRVTITASTKTLDQVLATNATP